MQPSNSTDSPTRLTKVRHTITRMIPFVNDKDEKPSEKCLSASTPSHPSQESPESDAALPTSSFRPAGFIMDFLAASGTKLRRKDAKSRSSTQHSHGVSAAIPARDLSDSSKDTSNVFDKSKLIAETSSDESKQVAETASDTFSSFSSEQYRLDGHDGELASDVDSNNLSFTETSNQCSDSSFAAFDDDCYSDDLHANDDEGVQSLSPWQSSFVNFLRNNESARIDGKSDTSKGRILKRSICMSIADNMKSIFDLSDDDELIGKFDAWLVHDIMLRGHLYLTRQSLIFLALLPKNNLEQTRRNPDFLSEAEWANPADIIHVGPLGLKVKRMVDSSFSTPITHRYMAVLKSKTLSIYNSATEWYFPTLLIDILTCTRVEILDSKVDDPTLDSPTKGPKPKVKKDRRDFTDAVFTGIMSGVTSLPDITPGTLSSGEVWFEITSGRKTYKLQADSMFSARRWCGSIQKLVFQMQNTNKAGECLLKIPFDRISRYRNQNISEEKGVDAEDAPACFSVEYRTLVEPRHHHSKPTPQIQTNQFLLYEAAQEFLNGFKENASHFELEPIAPHPGHVISTLSPSKACATSLGKALNIPSQEGIDSFDALDSNKTSAFSKFGSLVKHPTQIFRSDKQSLQSSDLDNFSVSVLSSKCTAKPVALSDLKNMNMSLVSTNHDLAEFAGRQVAIGLQMREEDVKRLRLESVTHEIDDPLKEDQLAIQDSSKVHDLKESPSTLEAIKQDIQGFSLKSKLTATKPIHYVKVFNNDMFYEEKLQKRELANRKFQKQFVLGKKRSLIAVYSAHVTSRNLPKFGKLYVGLGVLCFKCSVPGISTIMILPTDDIEKCRLADSMKLGFSNLVFDIKGHPPITFEFNAQSVRDDCLKVVNSQLNADSSDSQTEPDFSQEYLDLISRNSTGIAAMSQNLSEQQLKSLVIGDARIKMYEDGLRAATGIDMPILLGGTPLSTTEVKPSASLHFVLLTIGSRGDVQPFVALGKGLIKEGHTVTIATHIEFEEFVTKNGLQFREIAGDPTDLMLLMVEHGTMSVAFLKEAGSKFRGWINELLRSSWDACQGADILIESPSAMAGAHVAEAMGIAYMRAFTMPWTRTHAYPHAFLVPDQPMGESYNYFTHVLFENVFWTGISGQVNKWRVEDLKLPKTNLKRLQQAKIPFLYNISPSVFPPATDFYDWVKVTGYWFLNEGATDDYKPPAELQEFMDKAKRDKKKIVYIGFGSIVVKDSKSLTQSVVDGVKKADVRCILNKGWLDRNTDDKDAHKPEVALPSQVFLLESVPHDWLFPKIDAAVHHGGSGTTGASVRLGIPTIIKPFFGDQFFFATDIEARGIGLELKLLSANSLCEALTKVTTDQDMIKRAKEFGERVDHEDGVTRAIVSIYEQFEYSKTLISAKQNYNARNGDASSDEEEDDSQDSS